MRDLHNNINIIAAVSPVAAATGQESAAIDLQGYNAAEIEFSYGEITATNTTFTPTVTESDSAAGPFTAVAAADLIGTLAEAGIAAGTRVAGVNSAVTRRIGYRGGKRYIKAGVAAVNAAAVLVGINVLRGHPLHGPAG